MTAYFILLTLVTAPAALRQIADSGFIRVPTYIWEYIMLGLSLAKWNVICYFLIDLFDSIL